MRGGVGRELDVPWTSRDDAMLLLGVYKHGYRAYEEVRNDPELSFSCRVSGPPLPVPMPQPDVPNGSSAPAFDAQDVLPVPPADQPRRVPPTPPPSRPPTFLQEKEFRERVKALLDALAEEEKAREDLALWEQEWEEERRKELRGEPARPPKAARSAGGPDNAASSAAAEAERTFESQLQEVWSSSLMDGGESSL